MAQSKHLASADFNSGQRSLRVVEPTSSELTHAPRRDDGPSLP